MTREVERLTKRAIDEVRVEPTCRQLMTVPGVGPFTALAFRATIDQPDRFRKSRDVGAHLGLTPRRYQSGETDVQGRISRCGDELARTGALRGSSFAADPQHQMVGVACLGHEHRQTPGHGTCPCRGCPQAGGDPAPHVGRWQPVPLGQTGLQRPRSQRSRQSSFRLTRAEPRRSRGDDGRGDLVESPEPAGSDASRSRDRLRHLVLLTPSCGGHAPTAKRSE